MSGANPTITPAANGPYIVAGLTSIRNSHGILEAQPKMALCRCGASANKPFCDGAHAKVGFSSENLVGRTEDQRDTYTGKNIAIHDNRRICAHAGKCTDGLPSVWRMGQEPWIDADGAEVEKIIEIVRSCPSGALSYSIEGVEHSAPQGDASIMVAKNGPYVVTGDAELVGEEFAKGASKEQYTLCRCGASKNKPFCDGSHWGTKFEDKSN